MGAGAAVGVDDDLAPREPAIALGTADHEAAGGVHEVLHVLTTPSEARLDDHLDHRVDRFLLHLRPVGHVGRVCVRDDYGVDLGGGRRRTRGDLALGVGPSHGSRPSLRSIAWCLTGRCVVDRAGRHRRLVACIAEREALVASAWLGIVRLVTPCLPGSACRSHQHGTALGRCRNRCCRSRRLIASRATWMKSTFAWW